MLRIPITSISEQEMVWQHKVDADRFPLLQAVTQKGSVLFQHPVHVRILARLAVESVVIEGVVKTHARMSCSRCLEPFDHLVSAEFSTTATPSLPTANGPDGAGELELSADEIDVIRYDGDSIDLTDELAQQIIMALPFKPLCRMDCRGLCMHCGANRNQTECRCDTMSEQSPFAVLKNLTLPGQKE